MLSIVPKKKKNGQKSKKLIKPTSLGRQQNRSRGKLQTNQPQTKKVSNKLLLSVSIQPEEKKPIHTYYRSTVETQKDKEKQKQKDKQKEKEREIKGKRLSPGLKKKKGNQGQSGVFKNEFVRKRDSHSVLEGKKSSKDKIGRSKKGRLVVDQRAYVDSRAGVKSNLTFYPSIAEELMMGFSSSDIFYSSNGQSRDEIINVNTSVNFKPNLTGPLNRNFNKQKSSFADSKKPSLNTLRKQELLQKFKEERAAIKIQKIWKGFKTRQILDHFLNDEIERLNDKRNELTYNRNNNSSLSGSESKRIRDSSRNNENIDMSNGNIGSSRHVNNDGEDYDQPVQFYNTFVDMSLNINLNQNQNKKGSKNQPPIVAVREFEESLNDKGKLLKISKERELKSISKEYEDFKDSNLYEDSFIQRDGNQLSPDGLDLSQIESRNKLEFEPRRYNPMDGFLRGRERIEKDQDYYGEIENESNDNDDENQDEQDAGQEDDDQDEDDSNFLNFPRQRPIHNHQQLTQQLRQLKQQQFLQNQYNLNEHEQHRQNQEDQFEDQEEYYHAYEPNETIMETNEEHIESRKNSMQNKGRNKKMFENSQRRISSEGGFYPSNTINEEMEVVETERRGKTTFEYPSSEKKQQHQKQNSFRENSPIDSINNNTPSHNAPSEDDRDPSAHHPYRTIEPITPSLHHHQHNKQKLKLVKQQQLHKWKNVVDYIKREVATNGNSLMEVLGNVVLMSETNMRELEEDESEEEAGTIKNLIENPRDLGKVINTYHMMSTEESHKKEQLNHEVQERHHTSQQSNVSQPHSELPSQPQSHSSQKRKNLRLQLDDRNSFSLNLNQPTISKQKLFDFQQSKKFESLPSPFQQHPPKSLLKLHTLESVLSKNQGFNIHAVEAIINLRENTLEQREKAEYNKLYDLFQSKKISEQEFDFMLLKLRRSAEQQRDEIEKSKKEIEKGLKVAAKVIAKAEKDAHMIGKRIGVSRSAESLSQYSKLNSFILLNKLGVGVEEDVVVPVFVDEGRPVGNQRAARNFFVNETDSNSDDLDFTEEEYRSFSKSNNHLSNEFAELNRNIIITQQFLRGEPPQVQHQNYQIEIPENTSPKFIDPRIQQYVNEVTEGILTRMMTETTIQFYKNSFIFETLSSKFSLQALRPKKVSKSEINQFISCVSSNLPETKVLQQRLNQKICPPPLELLKCMRVDLYPIDYDDQDNIEDIGKYEFIIPQAVCSAAIQKCSTQRTPAPLPANSPRLSQLLQNIQELDPELIVSLQHHSNFNQLKQQQLSERNQEVYISQMNCIFDCWNEQIIMSKSQVVGYSGIGINEGSLSLEDQNIQVKDEYVLEYVDVAKDKLLKIVNEDSMMGMGKRIEKMAVEEICSNQGAWVCYTDEALGFILELDFVVFEELLVEVAKIVHKKMMQNGAR